MFYLCHFPLLWIDIVEGVDQKSIKVKFVVCSHTWGHGNKSLGLDRSLKF